MPWDDVVSSLCWLGAAAAAAALRCFAAGGRLLPVAAGLLALVGYYTAG